MSEEVETQPEEIIEEQPKASFFNKLKIHKFKILGGVLGVLIFSGAVFGAYKVGQRKVQPAPQPTPTPTAVATPTPDLTANWKTYTSADFIFKYPADWKVRDLLSINRNLEWLKTSSIYLGLAPISIKEDVLASVRVTSDTMEKVVAGTKDTMLTPGTPTRLLSEAETQFNGYSATKLVFENTVAQVKNQYLIILREKKTYVLSGGGTRDTSASDLILSTFKFLPSTGSGQGE